MPHTVAAVLGSKTANAITELFSRADSEGLDQGLGAQERGLGGDAGNHQSEKGKDKEGSELRHGSLEGFFHNI